MFISLAPMEGITTYVYRNAINRHFGEIDYFYTPFLTASHIKGRELRDVDPKNNTVPRLIPQVLVNDADLFITITRQLEALGYDEVNLNLGCPSGTVTAKGRGAGFLDKISELDRFLDQIFDESPIDISIKTRIGAEFISEWEDIAAASALEKAYHIDYATDLRKRTELEDVAKRVYLGLPDIIKTYRPDTIVLGGPLGKIFRLYAKYLPGDLGVRLKRPKRPTESVIYGAYLYARQKERE